MSNYPYEIHITVCNAPSGNEFRRICAEINVKPIVLALQDRSNNALRDVMTSSVCIGDLEAAHVEARRIESGLRTYGLSPVRRKIETVPWNPLCELLVGPSNYFEAHVSICVPKYKNKVSNNAKCMMKEDCERLDLHVSSNMFKASDTDAVYMTTLREFGTSYEAFKTRTESAIAELQARQWNVVSHVIEYAVFDSNTQHDDEWMS